MCVNISDILIESVPSSYNTYSGSLTEVFTTVPLLYNSTVAIVAVVDDYSCSVEHYYWSGHINCSLSTPQA